jgi:outer membrane protein TolC
VNGSLSLFVHALLAASVAEPSPPPPPEVVMIDDTGPVDTPPPFRSDALGLSDALAHAARDNRELAIAALEVRVSEARVLAALGAWDVQVTADLGASISQTPQRGSQYAFDTGRRSIGGGVGIRRAIETGGAVAVDFDTRRMQIDQPNDPRDPTAGRTTLSAYSVTPTLTFSHALLRGAGRKVARAPVTRAKIVKTSAEAGRRASAQNVARDVIRGYWALLFAHRDLANKRRSASLVQLQIDRTARLVKAGRRSRLDLKAIEQAAAARDADVSRAENALLDASLALRRHMGQNIAGRDTLGLVPTTDPQVQPKTIVVEDEIARALETNPALRQLELELDALGVDARVAANARLPRLDVSTSFSPQGRSIDRAADPAAGVQARKATWGGAFGNIFSDDVQADGVLADWMLSGNVTLTWDVQNRSARGARQQVELGVEQVELRLAQAREDLIAEVVRTTSRLRTAGKTITAAELSEELARENLAAEQSKFELGRATNYDVLLRLDELDAAAALALGARVEYLGALAELQALTGEILPAYGLES